MSVHPAFTHSLNSVMPRAVLSIQESGLTRNLLVGASDFGPVQYWRASIPSERIDLKSWIYAIALTLLSEVGQMSPPSPPADDVALAHFLTRPIFQSLVSNGDEVIT